MTGYPYSHTQTGFIHWWCAVAATVFAGLAFAVLPESMWRWGMLGLSTCTAVAGLCLMSLTVVDKGKELSIRFGPLPFIKKRISYAKVADVTVAPTTSDSWGVRCIPGHDATYNLQAREYIELQLRNSTACIRVGTDDAEGLARIIRRRIGR